MKWSRPQEQRKGDVRSIDPDKYLAIASVLAHLFILKKAPHAFDGSAVMKVVATQGKHFFDEVALVVLRGLIERAIVLARMSLSL